MALSGRQDGTGHVRVRHAETAGNRAFNHIIIGMYDTLKLQVTEPLITVTIIMPYAQACDLS